MISESPARGDPEVRHARPPLAVDEHVAGLQVAMDDPVRVGEARRGEDLAGHLDASPDVSPRLIRSRSDEPSTYSIAM